LINDPSAVRPSSFLEEDGTSLKKTLVYVNPAAGSGKAEGIWRRLSSDRPEFEEAALVDSPDREVAADALREALSRESAVERIIAIGGDGTFHTVANVVMKLGLGGKVALGLVPAGTGSDLARALRVPRRPRRALDHLLSCPPRKLDVLRVEAGEHCRYSVNVASAGISGLVDEAVNSLPRKTAAVYVRETLSAALRYRPVRCRITVDGDLWYEGKVFLLAVANGRFFGRGMKIAPRAALDDGLADVVLVGPFPRWQLPLRMGRVFLGNHLSMADVRSCRARRVEVEALEDLPPMDLDGEAFAASSGRITVERGALSVLA